MDRPDYNKLTAVHDNGGKTVDRYTVVTPFNEEFDGEVWYVSMLGLSDRPTHPQGFSQWTNGQYHYGKDNSHLGKEIDWYDLPEHIQEHIIMRLEV